MARLNTFVRHRRSRKLMGEINVVPYIDVMLVLLVIFMVTAPLLTAGIDVELPETTASQLTSDDREPFVLTVDSVGNYYLNEESDAPASGERVRAAAAAVLRQAPDTPFLVRGDKNVAYGEVAKAMVMLQKAGVPSVGLVTESIPAQ